MSTLHLADLDLPEELWRAPQALLRAAHETGRIAPTPERITLALDLRGLDGPQVDIDCHAHEPEVDLWEAGLAVPTWDQLAALAQLTGFPIGFFYRPADQITGQVFICGPQDIDPPLPEPTDPASSTHREAGTSPRRPSRPRPNPPAARAAAQQVLAAREQRRRAREARDLIPAPPGWRNRR